MTGVYDVAQDHISICYICEDVLDSGDHPSFGCTRLCMKVTSVLMGYFSVNFFYLSVLDDTRRSFTNLPRSLNLLQLT